LIPLPLPTFIPRYLSPEVPGEWFGHLAFTHDLVAALRPSLLVQLGTFSGDSYFGFCQSIVELGLDCVCYGVLSSAGDSAPLASYNATHYEAFSHLLESGDSSRLFSENSIDLLHICALEYRTASVVFNDWLLKVKAGGFVLIDGIVNRDASSDAWRLWEHVESTFSDRFAFHQGGGLGVLRKPGGNPSLSPLLLSIMDGSAEAGEYVRRHYVIYSGYLDRILHTDGATQALSKKIEELTTELRAAQHERMFLETELKQTQFERNDARRTVDQVQGSLAAVQDADQARETQLQEENRRLNELLQSERGVIQALMHSLSWKVTAPLRAFMDALRMHKKP
jgi:hypothetical protein